MLLGEAAKPKPKLGVEDDVVLLLVVEVVEGVVVVEVVDELVVEVVELVVVVEVTMGFVLVATLVLALCVLLLVCDGP